MKKRTIVQLYFAAMLVAGYAAQKLEAQNNLQVVFGSKGIQTIAYGGVMLDDTSVYPQDAFHIWHMKSTDLNGNLLTNGGYGWGESNYGEVWNAQSNTETYTFSWGTIATRFVQTGNNLDMIVTESNNPGSGVIFDGAEIYPFLFHFPRDPAQFYGYNQFMITTTGPAVSAADFGAGVVTSVVPNESAPLYGGWKSAGNNSYWPIMASTSPDGLAPFLPRNDNPLSPGSSFTYTVSLRFTPEGAPADASDAYSSFTATYPSQMTWSDKRIIGTAYLASSPSNSDTTAPGGFPTNPRRYFNDPSVDVTNPAGLQAFQTRVLAQANNDVSTAQAMNSQGVLTWDLEGEEYPQNTTYVCSPDQIGIIAPEMESTITDRHSAYFGRKLDDAYFQTITGAGLKVGLCLRPQVFTLGPNGHASQVFLQTNSQIIANLEAKAGYANRRWGATLFYVDSTVDPTGGTLDPSIFQQLIKDFPGFLFIPEESTPRYYAYSAPFYSFIFHTDVGTPASTYKFYPNAFSATLVNDVSPDVLATYTPQLTQAVKHGDILMGHADYWQANDPTLMSIYKAAGAPAMSSQQIVPVINWATPPSIPYGVAVGAAQLNAGASVPGIFVYTPAAGTILDAGINTLSVTFIPADTINYKTATASLSLSVSQAVPVVQWGTPPSLIYGAALSTAQLNASASVPGSFLYTPAAGTVLPVGASKVIVTFTPSSANYTPVTTSTNITVARPAPAAPVLTWPASPPIVYGTALGGAQLNASANVPGNFVYTPAAGSVPSAGVTTLSVIFTPADLVNYKAATASSSVSVTQAIPVLQWPTPASIVSGSALSGLQLNASANVPGSFSYTPSVGTVLRAGSNTLAVTFTPVDTGNYTAASASTNVFVAQAPRVTPTISWVQPAGIIYGTVLSGLQLDASSQVSGSFAYSPGPGSMLNAGSNVLTTTFTPTDTTKYSVATMTVTLPVAKATPLVSWGTPVPVVAGTALSGTQLNASVNVQGTFVYSPSAGTVLNAGTATLSTTFTPTDGANYNVQNASVSLSVTGAPANAYVWIVSPGAGQTVSGTVTIVAGMRLFLDAAGSFLIVDGQPLPDRRAWESPYIYPLDTTTLSNGPHSVQVWAHDISNNVNVSSPVVINVANHKAQTTQVMSSMRPVVGSRR